MDRRTFLLGSISAALAVIAARLGFKPKVEGPAIDVDYGVDEGSFIGTAGTWNKDGSFVPCADERWIDERVVWVQGIDHFVLIRGVWGYSEPHY